MRKKVFLASLTRFFLPVILAIESSCDETSVAVIEDGRVLSNIIANQTIHYEYGGVVPELASRAHQENIVPATTRALEYAGKSLEDLDAVGITIGPGLLGSLLVGVSFAKSLAYSLSLPLIQVNHMQAHVLAHFAEPPYPSFPFICLTVSGGHTQIVLVRSPAQMEVVGETLDDAAGEAFDKAGKIFGLGYPAGPLIDRHAKNHPPEIHFPHPQVPGLNFSFSGLKTAVLNHVQQHTAQNPDYVTKHIGVLCASLQQTIISILMKKLVQAAMELNIRHVAIAGGVSANSGLRQALQDAGIQHGWETFIPKFEYCTDNAAMIGIAAHFKYQNGDFSSLDITPSARLPF